MPLTGFLTRSVRVPLAVAIAVPLVAAVAIAWAFALATDRNPLPFPDRHYHVFSASSDAGLVALEEVMAMHSLRPRFRVDSEGVQRTIFWNGTIINQPRPGMLEQLGHPMGALGFVVDDPDASALRVADLLKRHGLAAEVIRDAEPGLPITFVRTDALSGGILVFRRHVLHMGPRPEPWTPRDLDRKGGNRGGGN
jgi:hypothetical protein